MIPYFNSIQVYYFYLNRSRGVYSAVWNIYDGIVFSNSNDCVATQRRDAWVIMMPNQLKKADPLVRAYL